MTTETPIVGPPLCPECPGREFMPIPEWAVADEVTVWHTNGAVTAFFVAYDGVAGKRIAVTYPNAKPGYPQATRECTGPTRMLGRCGVGLKFREARSTDSPSLNIQPSEAT